MRIALAATAIVCALSGIAEAQQSRAESAARSLYEEYSAALRAGQRDRIGSFYSTQGAHTVLDGGHEYATRARMDSIYRSPSWQPPAFFTWDELNFRELTGGQVLVSGFFRWLPRGSADTMRFTYAALLQREAEGLRIRMEHEMLTPSKADMRLVGTWELVSTHITRNDSTVMQGGPPSITAIKILNATDYSVITRRDGRFARAGGGRYSVSGDRYTESVDLASEATPPGTLANFTFRLDGDRWVTEGASGAVRFRETWRRVR